MNWHIYAYSYMIFGGYWYRHILLIMYIVYNTAGVPKINDLCQHRSLLWIYLMIRISVFTLILLHVHTVYSTEYYSKSLKVDLEPSILWFGTMWLSSSNHKDKIIMIFHIFDVSWIFNSVKCHAGHLKNMKFYLKIMKYATIQTGSICVTTQYPIIAI